MIEEVKLSHLLALDVMKADWVIATAATALKHSKPLERGTSKVLPYFHQNPEKYVYNLEERGCGVLTSCDEVVSVGGKPTESDPCWSYLKYHLGKLPCK